MRMQLNKYGSIAFGVMALLLLAGMPVGAADSPYEDGCSTEEGVEMRLPRDNFLSQRVGTENDRIHAYAGEFMIMDDNIYLTDKDEKNDTIFTHIGGLDMRFEREDLWSFNLGAELRFYDFHRYDDADHSEFDINPEFTYTLNDMIEFEISGDFSKTESPIDSTTVAKIESHTHQGEFKLRITPSDVWGVDVTTNIIDKDFAVSQYRFLESDEYSIKVAPYYMVSDKLKIGMSMKYGDIDYRMGQKNESHYLDTRVSATYLPTDKLAYYLAIGWQDRAYKENGRIADHGDYSGLVYTGSVMYDYSDKLSFDLTGSRSPGESSVGNYYVLTRYSVGGTYMLVDRLKTGASLFTEHTDESNAKDNNRNGIELNVSYMLREWAGVGASYEHVYKNSDGANGDYVQNKTTIGMWMNF